MKRWDTQGLTVFLAIAEAGSLRGAARVLGLGPPAVSHQLKQLERRLGVDLFTRTTRRVEPTEAGRVLLARAAPALAELDEALEAARTKGQGRTGRLRITLPWSAYQAIFAPLLPGFMAAYPDIRLDLSIDDALVDIVEEGFHAGVRLGGLLSPDMVAIPLTPPLKGAYSATPDYLAAHGRPRAPSDLRHHACIRYRNIGSNRLADWTFLADGRVTPIHTEAHLTLDSFQAVVQAIERGLGIGWSLRPVVEEAYALGRLEPVLEEWTPGRPPFYLYYPRRTNRLTLLGVFVDFLRSGLRDERT
ncbi:MAG: LysR family transcriptional regulator [Rhodospirillum sp.]|nr:LysR family transcriptional regulator [Rhodospirillum sp.]MCF8489299.1 LysR family transcriptional regulator [Rhodospirillum sp.]MCF8500273.1 LysR family transcriptional regulator [Rhodospirillum sp.]